MDDWVITTTYRSLFAPRATELNIKDQFNAITRVSARDFVDSNLPSQGETDKSPYRIATNSHCYICSHLVNCCILQDAFDNVVQDIRRSY